LLAGHPQLVVTFVFAQIVTTLILIGWLANPTTTRRFGWHLRFQPHGG
jgi:hypothetical protein